MELLEDIKGIMHTQGYLVNEKIQGGVKCESSWKKKSALVFVGVGKFSDWARDVEVGLANAGTATEQLVGLGIPCVSMPGSGPQFKKSFAERQSRMLGGAVIPCDNDVDFALTVKSLLENKGFRQKLIRVGVKRMGNQGASESLVAYMVQKLFIW